MTRAHSFHGAALGGRLLRAQRRAQEAPGLTPVARGVQISSEAVAKYAARVDFCGEGINGLVRWESGPRRPRFAAVKGGLDIPRLPQLGASVAHPHDAVWRGRDGPRQGRTRGVPAV